MDIINRSFNDPDILFHIVGFLGPNLCFFLLGSQNINRECKKLLYRRAYKILYKLNYLVIHDFIIQNSRIHSSIGVTESGKFHFDIRKLPVGICTVDITEKVLNTIFPFIHYEIHYPTIIDTYTFQFNLLYDISFYLIKRYPNVNLLHDFNQFRSTYLIPYSSIYLLDEKNEVPKDCQLNKKGYILTVNTQPTSYSLLQIEDIFNPPTQLSTDIDSNRVFFQTPHSNYFSYCMFKI